MEYSRNLWVQHPQKQNMNIEELRDYCLAKKGVTEGFPFGEDTLVFKVMEKLFCLTGINNETCSANLKCLPDYALELREEYGDLIRPGYHMNKKHWNTVEIEALDEALAKSLIDHSYDLVVKGLPKKIRLLLESDDV